MYYVSKVLEVSASHCLHLDYESKCKNVHGHNWIITVHCKLKTLNDNGMVIDFTEIKKRVMVLDHDDLNNHLPNPTAENIAKYLCDSIPFCYKVDVQESEGNIASYESEEV